MTDRDRLIELNRQAKYYAQEKADERGGLVCITKEEAEEKLKEMNNNA